MCHVFGIHVVFREVHQYTSVYRLYAYIQILHKYTAELINNKVSNINIRKHVSIILGIQNGLYFPVCFIDFEPQGQAYWSIDEAWQGS